MPLEIIKVVNVKKMIGFDILRECLIFISSLSGINNDFSNTLFI